MRLSQHQKSAINIAIVITVMFIWGNSLLPPQDSWVVSDTVKNALTEFLPVGSATSQNIVDFGGLVRKLAHFLEFFLLGIILHKRNGQERDEETNPLFLGVLVALVDETIQAFNGRTSSVFDVWIDFSGIFGGVLTMKWYRTIK